MNDNELIEIRNEIANCNEAIKAFTLGAPHLAPDGLADAPNIDWLRMQRRGCIARLDAARAARHAAQVAAWSAAGE